MMLSMLEKIEELMSSFKNETVYLHYIECEKKLMEDPLKSLLEELQKKKNLYLELQPYEKYQALTCLKNEILLLASQVEDSEDYKAYFKAKKSLDERITVVNDIIFHSLNVKLGGENHACNCR